MDTITRFLQRKWFYHFASFIFRTFVKIVYGLDIYGPDKVPHDRGLVVASNHFSAFDPPIMGVSVPREIHYMAKKELFENRYLRALVLGLRAYPVDRAKSDTAAIKGSLRRLRAGLAIGIFAQGTRKREEAKVLDGAAYLAQRAEVPLLPAAIWRNGRRFCVAYGEPIMPQGLSREEARAMTRALIQQIRALIPEEVRDNANAPSSSEIDY